jgi:hypothetical protein
VAAVVWGTQRGVVAVTWPLLRIGKPILESLDDKFARGDHLLEQETKKGWLDGFGRVLFRGTSRAEVV